MIKDIVKEIIVWIIILLIIFIIFATYNKITSIQYEEPLKTEYDEIEPQSF